MRISKILSIVPLALFGLVAVADAKVGIHIDLGKQRMYVESSHGKYTWRTSTARSGYQTPKGTFAPIRLERMHYSRKYNMEPMPYAIFFRGGYAIHGSLRTQSLGRPVSHGCVRLSPSNAALLFRMVKAEGARISITGKPPHAQSYSKRRGWRESA